MKIRITRYDEELVEHSARFIQGADGNPESVAILARYGFSPEELARGKRLVKDAQRSFEWERAGKAYNFLSPTEERREVEARDWYADRRRRYVRRCLRRAEEAAGWTGEKPASRWPLSRKLTLGTAIAVAHASRAVSPFALVKHRRELAENLERARTPKPADAPPPKDSALVELAGWYERWRLLAQRVFRERPDLMAPFGLKPGKAPPRLRSRSARAKYGEGAAGSINGNGSHDEAVDDPVEMGLELPEPAESPSGDFAASSRQPEPATKPKSLRIVN